MKKQTLEEIEKQSKQTEASLERLSLEKKKLHRKESELFELHLSSLRPLRELQNLAQTRSTEKKRDEITESVRSFS